jgi:hypothetical protein
MASLFETVDSIMRNDEFQRVLFRCFSASWRFLEGETLPKGKAYRGLPSVQIGLLRPDL